MPGLISPQFKVSYRSTLAVGYPDSDSYVDAALTFYPDVAELIRLHILKWEDAVDVKVERFYEK